MCLDSFHVYVPAFMIGHLMHRNAGQDLALPLFIGDHTQHTGPCPVLRVALNVWDYAPMVPRGDCACGAAGYGRLRSMPWEVGSCPISIVAPSHPLQASGIPPAHGVRLACPNLPFYAELIDNHYFASPWDPDMVAPRAGRSSQDARAASPDPDRPRGFTLELVSSAPLPILASPVAHVGEPLPRGHDSDSDVISWCTSESLDGNE